MPETISFTNFIKLLEQRLAGAAVSPETISLVQAGAIVTGRLAGGYITQLKLAAPGGGPPVTVFYDDPEPASVTRPKKNASHVMAPVGVNNGAGGQHGIYRWSDYLLIDKSADSFILQSHVPDEYPVVQKTVRLTSGGLTMLTKIVNKTSQTLRTSLGEHLYWYLEGGNAKDLRVVFQDSPDAAPFTDPRILTAVMAGESYFWLPSSLRCRIYRPDGAILLLESTARITDKMTTRTVPVGMLMWRRPDTESICFEPAIGIETDIKHTPLLTSSLANRGLQLAPGGKATLETHISVVM